MKNMAKFEKSNSADKRPYKEGPFTSNNATCDRLVDTGLRRHTKR